MSVQKLLATFVAVLLTATPLAVLTSSPASAQSYVVVDDSDFMSLTQILEKAGR